jgi:prevent-host-death family protein
MPTMVNVHEGKTHFSRLLDPAHAGPEIILTKAGRPDARLMPLASHANRRPGRPPGRRGDAFLDPLPDEEWAAWEGR